MGLAMIEAIESEAELFALAEQVDSAEKSFHDALARRNEAQIAYLREPGIKTRVALEAAKTEILDAEVRWLASTRATTRGQARRQHRRRHLATVRTGNRS